MTTRAKVEAVIDSEDPRNGLAVVESSGKLLAERAPLEGGGYVVLFMPPEGPQAPVRAEVPARRGEMPASTERPA